MKTKSILVAVATSTTLSISSCMKEPMACVYVFRPKFTKH